MTNVISLYRKSSEEDISYFDYIADRMYRTFFKISDKNRDLYKNELRALDRLSVDSLYTSIINIYRENLSTAFEYKRYIEEERIKKENIEARLLSHTIADRIISVDSLKHFDDRYMEYPRMYFSSKPNSYISLACRLESILNDKRIEKQCLKYTIYYNAPDKSKSTTNNSSMVNTHVIVPSISANTYTDCIDDIDKIIENSIELFDRIYKSVSKSLEKESIFNKIYDNLGYEELFFILTDPKKRFLEEDIKYYISYYMMMIAIGAFHKDYI